MTRDRLEQARRHIEDHVGTGLSLGEIARAAGLSPFHFARAFAARFGMGPVAYVRLRRLSLAADRLARPDPPPLVELAFDAGFDSQQAFTRAFKRAFGAAPGRFAAGRAARKEIPPMSDLAPGRLTQAPRPVMKPALRIAGLTEQFDADTVSGIPALWDRFAPRLPLPGQAGGATYGVCASAGDDSGGLRYTAGAGLAPEAAVPEGLQLLELAARPYLVFSLELDGGPLHPQMQASVKEIWGERLPASPWKLAQAPDLEVYPADFRPEQPGGRVEWWIPVEA